jgi:hypothetical protein
MLPAASCLWMLAQHVWHSHKGGELLWQWVGKLLRGSCMYSSLTGVSQRLGRADRSSQCTAA